MTLLTPGDAMPQLQALERGVALRARRPWGTSQPPQGHSPDNGRLKMVDDGLDLVENPKITEVELTDDMYT